MVKIAYCQATFKRDIELTKECIKRVSPYVDVTIIAYDQSVTDGQLKWFEDNGDKYRLEMVRYQWEDNMPEMRNQYLDRAKELEVNWLCVSDPDEIYSEDLCKELRRSIEKYDHGGVNMIGVLCRDLFINFDWLDDLDKNKEQPGGKETDFWKPILIFKLYPDIRYEGVGKEKTVHETLVRRDGIRVKSINLDKKYYYVHKKNAMTIWRNAARNMFIGGGGDNVGDLNTLWVMLRDITGENGLGLKGWNEFEAFINKGMDWWLRDKEKKIRLDNEMGEVEKSEEIEKYRDLIQQMESWFIEALQAGSNPWQTETRETAKFYYAVHPEEVDDFILRLINWMPQIMEGSDTDIEAFVRKTYFEALGRHPDAKGLGLYVGKIKDGLTRREDLYGILKDSQEYREKFKDIDKIGITTNTVERFKDIKVDIKNLEMVEKFIRECYTNILGRTVDQPGLQNYIDLITNEKMKPEELIEILEDSNEYKMKFSPDINVDHINVDQNIVRQSPFIKSSRSRGQTGFGFDLGGKGREILDLDSIDASKYNTVGLCIMTPSNDIKLAIETIKIIGSVVNEIHIQSDAFKDGQIKELKGIGKEIGKDIEIHIVEWKDDFGDYKNKACGHARTEWVLILDHDEVPTVEMAKKLKEIVLKSDRGNNFDIVSFDVTDEIWGDGENTGKLMYQNRNKGGKQLLHWNIPNVYTGHLHIWLKSSYYPWKTIHAPYSYRHIKTKDEVLERSARNVILGGGGDTVEDRNPLWRELTGIRDSLGLKTWQETNEYLKKGNIDIRMIEIFEKLSKLKWKDEELRDLKKYYLKLHPTEEGRFV